MDGIWEFIWRWETLWFLLLIVYVPCCVGLITIVLLQKGKGTGFAGAFGMGGGSEAVFGPRAGKSLPVRLTKVMAGLFLTLALIMSLVAGRVGKGVAPELVDEPSEEVSGLTGLDDLDIGGKRITEDGKVADASDGQVEAAPEGGMSSTGGESTSSPPESGDVAAPSDQPADDTDEDEG